MSTLKSSRFYMVLKYNTVNKTNQLKLSSNVKNKIIIVVYFFYQSIV